MGHIVDAGGILHPQKLLGGGPDGHAHVGAGIAVRHGEYVEGIHPLPLVPQVVGGRDHGVPQNLTSYHNCYAPFGEGGSRPIAPPSLLIRGLLLGLHGIDVDVYLGHREAGAFLHGVAHLVDDAAHDGGDVHPVGDGDVDIHQQAAVFAAHPHPLVRGLPAHEAGAHRLVGGVNHPRHPVAFAGGVSDEVRKIFLGDFDGAQVGLKTDHNGFLL